MSHIKAKKYIYRCTPRCRMIPQPVDEKMFGLVLAAVGPRLAGTDLLGDLRILNKHRSLSENWTEN